MTAPRVLLLVAASVIRVRGHPGNRDRLADELLRLADTYPPPPIEEDDDDE